MNFILLIIIKILEKGFNFLSESFKKIIKVDLKAK